ncbi:MAG: hypothetical protein M3340_03165 [Actinomycetota bacterium]|nr:hypothetical protein [Actinomycetota bacterium]
MDLITELLRLSLLEAVGDDAQRADKLRAAAATLAGRLTGDERAAVQSAVLASIEPGEGAHALDGSVFALAEQALLAEWETLPNAFPETPRELLRAVLATAVAQAAERNASVRLAGWYTLRSGLEQHGGGRWAPVLGELLEEWSVAVASELGALWLPAPASSALRMPSVKPPDGFTMSTRQELIDRAAEYAGQPNYQHFFAQVQSHLANDVTRLINLAEGAGYHGAKLANDQLKQALSSLGDKLREAFALHERGLDAVRLRGELLWWQQSQYSPALERGYEELASAAQVTVASAVDLHALVPPATPIAVEHVLSRLVRSLTAEGGTVAVEELAQAGAADLQAGPSLAPATLLASAASGSSEALAPALAATDGWRPERAAVLLFRDLQAARALAPEGE